MQYVILLVILSAFFVFGIFSNYLIPKPQDAKMKEKIAQQYPVQSTPTPTITPENLLTVTEDDHYQQNYSLVTIPQINLTLIKPIGWQIKPGTYREFTMNGKKSISGAFSVNANDSHNYLNVNIDHQGDICPGPNPAPSRTLNDGFGLPGIQYDCGEITYIFYGDWKTTGSVWPNILFSTNAAGDPQIQQILTSIKYNPQ